MSTVPISESTKLERFEKDTGILEWGIYLSLNQNPPIVGLLFRNTLSYRQTMLACEPHKLYA